MIENVIITATGPASAITSVLTHRSVFWLVKYAFIYMMLGMLVIPLLTDFTLGMYIEHTFGAILSFTFGTIPFGIYDTAISIFGKNFSFLFVLVLMYYYIVLFTTIFLVIVEVANISKREQLKTLPSAERMEHDRKIEEYVKQHPNEFVNGNTTADPNDELLVFGLTTNRKIIEAEVQANAIAKAFRNQQ